MPTSTANLGLYKYNTSTDAKEVFSINTALNNNWDKIDQGVGTINTNITKINNTITTLSTEISSIDVSNKVSKSGDTMTGNLSIDKESPAIIFKDARYTFSDATQLSSSINDYLYFRDTTGVTAGCIQNHVESTQNRMCLAVRNLGDTTTENSALPRLAICANASNVWTTCPASGNSNNSILTNVSINSAANGYCKLGNNLLIQWGYKAATANESTDGVTISFPLSFANTNYQVVQGFHTKNSDGGMDFQDIGIVSKAKGSFVGRVENTDYMTGYSYIAIGSWT